MAIAVVVDFPGTTADQYDQIIAKLGLTPGGAANPGQLFHWVSVTREGTRVTDVWESRETFDKFVQDRLGPISVEVGLPAPPTMTFYEVYNYFTEGPDVS